MAKLDLNHIYNVYASVKESKRDERVSDRISLYFKNNIQAIADGIISNIPKISLNERNKIGDCYNIESAEWNDIKRSPEFFNIKQLASVLHIGLCISYIETKNRQFLVYLFILYYSAVYQKYMRKGSHNALIMKYTIDTSDNRTDFKKYNCSLIEVVNKKLDAYIENYSDILKKNTLTDRDIVTLLQASKTRLNDMFKTLYNRYKQNYHSDDVKVMMEYSKTKDGKHVLSMQNVFDKLRELALDELYVPSDVILNRVGLSAKNVQDFRYRHGIISSSERTYIYYSKATSLIIDKWVTQNHSNNTIDEFKKHFIRTLMKGRNVRHIYEVIDEAVDIIVRDNTEYTYNKITLRNYIYKYLVINIYSVSNKVFKD